MPVVSISRVAAAVAAIAFLAANADAQPQAETGAVERLRAEGFVVARSAGTYPSQDVVQYVAENAAKLQIPITALERSTPRQVVERVCGSAQPGYQQLFSDRNRGTAIAWESPLDATTASQAIFPACLYANVQRGRTISAASGDTQTAIAQLYTGFGKNDRLRLTNLFGKIKKLALGEAVNLELVTAPTLVRPLVGIDNFRKGLERAGGSETTVREVTVGGILIEPSDKPCNGSVAAPADGDVVARIRNSYPFEPATLFAAYEWTRNLRIPRIVRVMIVDNGFWGVPPCDGPSCLDEAGQPILAEPFPRLVFATDDYVGDIAPQSLGLVEPINYMNKLAAGEIDAVRGHGTHVAGLALGGPTLMRSMLGLPNDSWAKLSIINLAPGGRTFPSGADQGFYMALNVPDRIFQPDVVNMSFALKGDRATALRQALLPRDDEKTLFVAAAGNDGAPLEDVGEFPASLGGPTSRNVMTVAAIDADGRISSFSSWSGDGVDIAAPGCRIGSWLKGDGKVVPASGTSQAAPFVSFAAAAVRSLWEAPAALVKARLIYSGTLIEPADDRAKVQSGVRLNLFQAMLLRDDLVVARNPTRMLLGRVDKLNLLSCLDGRTPMWANVRSIKRGSVTRIFWKNVDGRALSRCDGDVADTLSGTDNIVSMKVTAEFVNGAFRKVPKRSESVVVRDLVDLVRSELTPN